MAVIRNWAIVLFAVVVCAHNTECRSAKTDPHAIDYTASDGDQLSTNITPDEGMMDDARDDWQADGDGDYEEEEEPIIQQALLSKPLSVDARLGETVLLPCDIANSSKTSHEVVSWQHEGTMLFQGSHSYIAKIEHDTKIVLHSNWSIEIPALSASDEGAYTCELIASEPQKVTHNLRVLTGPRQPSIKRMEPESPQDRRILEGRKLVITCLVEGYPKPVITWSKTTADTKQNRRVSSADGARFEPDSLVIDKVERHHEGEYFCMADNGVGKPAIRSLAIQVVGTPAVHVHSSLVNAAVGVTAVLGCTVHYEPRSVVTWTKDGRELQESVDVAIEDDYPTSRLRIPVVHEEDFGTYTCIARNQFGEHNRSASLVQEPVLEPISVTADALVWRVHSHQPLDEVLLEIRNAEKEEQFSSEPVSAQPTAERHVHAARFPLQALEPGARYEARVRARNAHGWGAATPTVSFQGVMQQENPESIQVAGVGASLSSASAQMDSFAVSSFVICLLARFV